MQVKDLSKELNIQNKELISYLKNEGFKISSHMQNVDDEMIDLAREKFSNVVNTKVEIKETVKEENKIPEPVSTKIFNPDDLIPCKSIIPWKNVELGVDRITPYIWEYFGEIQYVKYKDLQSWRAKNIIKEPQILIEDEDLCYQWRRELGNTYKYYLGIDYPEDFFDLNDDEFEKILKEAPDVIKRVVATTARIMINNENYPSINKINKIDEILGTCMKEFI